MSNWQDLWHAYIPACNELFFDKVMLMCASNQDGVRASKSGDHVRAVVAFTQLIERTRSEHLTHLELHVCYSNRAASHLALQLYSEALNDAERCIAMMRCVVCLVCCV